MSKAVWTIAAGLLLTVICGCGGGSSTSNENKEGLGQAGNAAGAAPGGAAGAPPGAVGMPGGAAPGNAAAAGNPAQAAPENAAPVESAASTGDVHNFIPASITSAVGGHVPTLMKKETPGGTDALNLLQSYLAVFQRAGIAVGEVERIWAGTGRENGELIVCVRTKTVFDANKVVKAFGVTAKGEPIGPGLVFDLPSPGQFSVAVVGTRTALIGNKEVVTAAMKNNPPGSVRLGLEALAPSHPYYWVAGDDKFGQSHFDQSLLAMVNLHSAEAVKLDCRGFAMGLTEGEQQASAASGGQTRPSGGPMGAGPMGAGPMGAGPMGAGPMGAGPMGAGPMGAGPMGAGPVGAGPMGAGPMGAGPMGAGPMGAGPMGAGPMGAGPMGAGPMGAGPMGAGPMGAGPMGAGPMGAGMSLPGQGGGQAAAPSAQLEFTVAIALESEGQVGVLSGRINDVFELADNADKGRQEGAAKAKAQKDKIDATLKAIQEQSQTAANGQGGAAKGPNQAGQPGMAPPGAAGGPPGGALPGQAGALPGQPGAVGAGPGAGVGAAGAMRPPGQNGQNGKNGENEPVYQSTITRPSVVKDKAFLRIARKLPLNPKNVAAALNWIGTAGRHGSAPMLIGGQLQPVYAAVAAQPELKGQIALTADPFARHSWIVQLLPNLGPGGKEIYDQIDLRKSPLDPKNMQAASHPISEFLNPGASRITWSGGSLDGMALTHFVGMSGVDDANRLAMTLPRSDPHAGIFGAAGVAKPNEITDGANQTIMLIGVDQTAGPWMLGGGSTIRGAREPFIGKLGFSTAGLDKPGTVVLMADGSVRSLTEGMDPEVFKALCTTHGAEQVDLKGLNLTGDPAATGQPAPGVAVSR